MATVYERLKKIIVMEFLVEEEKITPSANFADDLGLDSLDLVELVMDIEDEFSNGSLKVDIPDEDTEKILTVQNAVDYLKDLGIKDD